MIEELLEEQVIFNEIDEKKQESVNKKEVVIVEPKKVEVAPVKKDIVNSVEQKKVSPPRKGSPSKKVSPPKKIVVEKTPCLEESPIVPKKGILKNKSVSIDVKNKAEIVASVMGGEAKDYFEIVTLMPEASVEDLVLQIITERDTFVVV